MYIISGTGVSECVVFEMPCAVQPNVVDAAVGKTYLSCGCVVNCTLENPGERKRDREVTGILPISSRANENKPFNYPKI